MVSYLKAILGLALLGLTLGTVGCAAPAGTTRAMADNGYHTQRVVYHINDTEAAGAALRNIQNHINAVGAQNVQIVVVSHGKGIDFLLDGWQDSKGKEYSAAVQNLVNQGVVFDICNNTLTGRKIDRDRVNLNAVVVPSGVATVAELQGEGYVYIKP